MNPIGAPALAAALALLAGPVPGKIVVGMRPFTIAAGSSEKVVDVDLRSARSEVRRVAGDAERDLVLELAGVEADRPPAATSRSTSAFPAARAGT